MAVSAVPLGFQIISFIFFTFAKDRALEPQQLVQSRFLAGPFIFGRLRVQGTVID